MFIAPIRKEDMLQVKKIHAISYDFASDLKYKEEDFEDGIIIGAYDGDSDDCRGTLFAVTYLNKYTMSFDGHWTGACGIGGVATLPEYRHKGGIKKIFEYGFEAMEKRGDVFSLLYPFSHAYYNKFGYECCMKQVKFSFDFSCLYDFERNTRCRLVENRSDEELHLLYTGFAARHNCAFDRNRSGWNTFPADPWGENRYTYLYYNKHGKPSGYFVFSSRREGDGKVFRITELVYDTPDDLRGIFGFIRVFDPNYKSVEIEKLPDDEDFTMAFSNYYKFSKTEYYNAMARVVNFEKAFTLMRYPEESGSFSIKATDAFLQKNTGIYDISYNHGVLSDIKKRDEGECDIAVTERTLARLILGTERVLSEKMKYDSGLELYSNAETLGKVFTKKTMFLNDAF